MGEATNIEWADHTFNPWIGCQRVSEACRNCYAERLDARMAFGGDRNWGPAAPRYVTSANNWREPRRWNHRAEAEGCRRRVFCSSLADVFEARPDLVEPRRRLFDLIRATPWLDWLLLTKRPECIAAMHQPAPNVWLGTTVENQGAVQRVADLVRTPAAVHFLSLEPLLEDVTLDLAGIDWVIVGGESGPNARPMQIEWVRSLRDQCAAHGGVRFFFKQWGEHDAEGRRVGKRAAGRLLDGAEHSAFPMRLGRDALPFGGKP